MRSDLPPGGRRYELVPVPKPGDADNQPDEPKGVFDGDKSLEFPPGYPLVDGEVVEVDNTPAASADQVAMLNRMFGGLQDPE